MGVRQFEIRKRLPHFAGAFLKQTSNVRSQRLYPSSGLMHFQAMDAIATKATT